MAPVIAMLVTRGAGIDEVRRNRLSLEETFLELVTEDANGPSGRAP
jgi:hypothetical protein